MARLLIVEDEPLIAMMLEEWVVELGHTTVGAARTVEAALSFVASTQIDAAIVDFHLQSETAEVVARALIEKNVPFAVASGSSMDVHSVMSGAACTLKKPYDFDSLSAAIVSLIKVKPSG